MELIITTLPTPLQLILDPVSLIILGLYATLMLWESLFPARALPYIRFWKLKGLLAFTLFFLLSSYLPLIWDTSLAKFQLFNLESLGNFVGTLVGILLYELGIYIWHRTMHSSNILWRVFHQMHHSAERIDSFGAFYFSPLDMIGFTFIGSLTLVLVAGFTPEATTYIILITTFLAIFQHSNIRTPVWLGYIVQRPESHSLHHAKKVHRYNYADLPIFDIIFGTFKNPKGYKYEAGFYPGASNRIKDMLLFRDISNSDTA